MFFVLKKGVGGVPLFGKRRFRFMFLVAERWGLVDVPRFWDLSPI